MRPVLHLSSVCRAAAPATLRFPVIPCGDSIFTLQDDLKFACAGARGRVMEISGAQDTPPETGTASMRPAGMFMALCMAIIAGSAGAIVYLYLGVSRLEAAIVAGATLIALVLYSALSDRVGFRSILARRLTELSQG